MKLAKSAYVKLLTPSSDPPPPSPDQIVRQEPSRLRPPVQPFVQILINEFIVFDGIGSSKLKRVCCSVRLLWCPSHFVLNFSLEIISKLESEPMQPVPFSMGIMKNASSDYGVHAWCTQVTGIELSNDTSMTRRAICE